MPDRLWWLLWWASWLLPTHLAGWVPHYAMAAFVGVVSLVSWLILARTRASVSEGLAWWAFAGSVGWLLFSAIAAPRIEPSISGAFIVPQWFLSGLPALVLLAGLRRETPLNLDWTPLVLALACTVGLGLLGVLGEGALFQKTAGLWGETKTSYSAQLGRLRISIPFENPNYLAFSAVSALFLALSVRRAAGSSRGTAWVVALLATGAVLFSGSRSMLLAAVLVVAVASPFRRLFSPWNWLLAGIPVFFLWEALQGAGLGARFEELFLVQGGQHQLLEARSTLGRIDAWLALGEVLSGPLAIWGTGVTEMERFAVLDGMVPFWLVRGGAVGGWLMLVVWIAAGVRLIELARWRLLAFYSILGGLLLTGAYMADPRIVTIVSLVLAAVASRPLDPGPCFQEVQHEWSR